MAETGSKSYKDIVSQYFASTSKQVKNDRYCSMIYNFDIVIPAKPGKFDENFICFLACTALIYMEILGIVLVPWDLFDSGLWRTMYLHPYHLHFALFQQGMITLIPRNINIYKLSFVRDMVFDDFYHARYVTLNASLSTPIFRLRKKSWEMIQLNDFACPPIMVKAGAVLPQGSKHQIFRPPM